MNMLVFCMNIVDKQGENYIINISYKDKTTQIFFCPETKYLSINNDNYVSKLLKNNEYQLRKILHNKKKNTFYIGFNLIFSLRDEKDVKAFNDRTKIVVLDKRKDKESSYVVDSGKRLINEIYIDGSFSEKKNKGGYAILHKNLNGNYKLYLDKSEIKSSSLLELQAAIKGLELLRDIDEIRIVTDSQYVRKGLTEWIFNWKLNNWYTANGEKVKNIDYWKKFDIITNNKYIEFQWVKAHSDHFENTLCDLYAKDMASQEN